MISTCFCVYSSGSDDDILRLCECNVGEPSGQQRASLVCELILKPQLYVSICRSMVAHCIGCALRGSAVQIPNVVRSHHWSMFSGNEGQQNHKLHHPYNSQSRGDEEHTSLGGMLVEIARK